MIRDVTLSLVTRVVLIGAGVLTSVITARALGVAGRGEYFFVLTLAGLAAQFGNFGLPSSNTYAVAKDHSLLPRLAANSFWIALLGGTVAACGIVISLGYPEQQHSGAGPSWMAIVMVPTMIYGMVASGLLIGLSRVREYNLFQLGITGFQLLAIVLAAWIGWGVLAFLLVSALAGAVGAGALGTMLGRFQRLSWRFDLPLFRSQFTYAGKAYLATLFAYGVSRAGVLLIDAFSGKAEIGIYSVALQFVDILVIVPATVAMVLFPDLMKQPPGKRFARTMRTTAQVTCASAALCALTGVAAIWIVPLFFGSAFAPAIEVLWWMLPGALALGFLNIVSQYLAAVGIPSANVWAWLLSLILMLLAGSYLIPQRGAIGAAMSVSIWYTLLAIGLFAIALRHHRLADHPSPY